MVGTIFWLFFCSCIQWLKQSLSLKKKPDVFNSTNLWKIFFLLKHELEDHFLNVQFLKTRTLTSNKEIYKRFPKLNNYKILCKTKNFARQFQFWSNTYKKNFNWSKLLTQSMDFPKLLLADNTNFWWLKYKNSKSFESWRLP